MKENKIISDCDNKNNKEAKNHKETNQLIKEQARGSSKPGGVNS